jgi:hypothetical protein
MDVHVCMLYVCTGRPLSALFFFPSSSCFFLSIQVDFSRNSTHSHIQTWTDPWLALLPDDMTSKAASCDPGPVSYMHPYLRLPFLACLHTVVSSRQTRRGTIGHCTMALVRLIAAARRTGSASCLVVPRPLLQRRAGPQAWARRRSAAFLPTRCGSGSRRPSTV